MSQLRFFRVVIPFRQRFKHGSAERAETQAVWVEASQGGLRGVGEGCPREYVTGETLDSAASFFAEHQASWESSFHSYRDLADWASAHEPLIDADPAAWCAVELAYLDLFAKQRGQSIEECLSLAPTRGVFRYTAVVGDDDAAGFEETVERYREMGFCEFKIKLSRNLARDSNKLSILRSQGIADDSVRVDANNLWSNATEALRHLSGMEAAFFGIEEPVAASDLNALREIHRRTECRIILDESFSRASQLEALASDPQTWILNVRVSKMGGIRRSLEVLRRARELGLPIIVGAQVGETSLLTRAGIVVAGVAGASLVAQEGAFGTLLLAEDVCDPPLMFGAGGVLDCDALDLSSRPGLGIEVSAEMPIFRALI